MILMDVVYIYFYFLYQPLQCIRARNASMHSRSFLAKHGVLLVRIPYGETKIHRGSPRSGALVLQQCDSTDIRFPQWRIQMSSDMAMTLFLDD